MPLTSVIQSHLRSIIVGNQLSGVISFPCLNRAQVPGEGLKVVRSQKCEKINPMIILFFLIYYLLSPRHNGGVADWRERGDRGEHAGVLGMEDHWECGGFWEWKNLPWKYLRMKEFLPWDGRSGRRGLPCCDLWYFVSLRPQGRGRIPVQAVPKIGYLCMRWDTCVWDGILVSKIGYLCLR